MTAFEKWNGFIEQLIYFECPADNEKSRLRAELALIEKTNSAEYFQAVYDINQSLFLNDKRCYLTGEAEEWFIFSFLDMTGKQTSCEALPSRIPKVTFAVPKGRLELARVLLQHLPMGRYEMIEVQE